MHVYYLILIGVVAIRCNGNKDLCLVHLCLVHIEIFKEFYLLCYRLFGVRLLCVLHNTKLVHSAASIILIWAISYHYWVICKHYLF